jgi:hypothetical protein
VVGVRGEPRVVHLRRHEQRCDGTTRRG